MPTVAITGRQARIRSSTAVASTATTSQTAWAELRDYTLTLDVAEIDVTNHDSSGWHENLTGIRTWRGTGAVNYLSTGAGQAALRTHTVTGNNPISVNMTFMQTTSPTAKKWQGKARITSWDLSHPTDNAVLGNIAFIGTGALTRVA